MDIDIVLSKTAIEIFTNLETGEGRIIKIIAKNGPLNKKEIGKATSRYTMGFDRWGVKKRLYGSKQFEGLISNDCIFPIKTNHKETKYGLTLKGLFSLHSLDFKKNYLVQNFNSNLKKKIDDQKIRDWIIDFIKFEIALILYYIRIQGLDWTRYKQTRFYIQNLKQNSEEILVPFYFNREIMNEKQKKEYDEIKDEYLKLVMILKWIKSIFSEKVEDFKDRETFKKNKEKREIDELLHDSTNNWYMNLDLLDSHINKKRIKESFVSRDPYYNTSKYVKKKMKKWSQTFDMLKKDYSVNGFGTMPS